LPPEAHVIQKNIFYLPKKPRLHFKGQVIDAVVGKNCCFVRNVQNTKMYSVGKIPSFNCKAGGE